MRTFAKNTAHNERRLLNFLIFADGSREISKRPLSDKLQPPAVGTHCQTPVPSVPQAFTFRCENTPVVFCNTPVLLFNTPAVFSKSATTQLVVIISMC